MEKAIAKVEMREWMGYTHGPNPLLIPPGTTQDQQNLQCLSNGVLTCRRGLRRVTFSNDTTDSTAEIVHMYRYSRPEGEWIVYCLSDGSLKAGFNPS